MDIYQFAMKMEKDGENYYRQLALESKVEGLTRIFTMLADEEVKHYEVVEKLSRKESNPQLADTPILSNVKNVFSAMRDEKNELFIDTTAASNSFRKACTIEADSEKFYREKAAQATDQHEQQILSRLAREEANHLRVMETLLEFVSRPEPGNWLEDAEWPHLEEY
ncbi:ferritin-like domain-containing protein [Desulfurivibrio dismutans]|uniref:ferritin-like domain-containing protein n=1 Tax=Desulfurivibrio dismutans TaxID=1398908 RepID=UPI0023DC43E8|nr:ferritin family protein [Desulfurivibrio alkaliphilus]MDF1614382.1 ferritin family protein [Desulfurivibrio alkaliphilus]